MSKNDVPSAHIQTLPSFAEQRKGLNQQQRRLDIEIVRVHSIHKQKAFSQLWFMDQQALCSFFTNYEPFPQHDLDISEILESSRLKLMRGQGRIYFGQIINKKREGKGISMSKEGGIYQGEYCSNEKEGSGVQIYPNGNVYIGSFQKGKKHGEGRFYWFNLSSKNPQKDEHVEFYEGEWWGGLPDGQGMHQKINGDLYIGQFKNGLKHKEGKQWYSSGDFYKGEFVNGLPQGYGQYYWQEGSSFKGDFKQGRRSGYGVWKAGNDKLESHQGHYDRDKKSGYGVYQWNNGWSYKGNFEGDYRNGYGELYDSQQQLIYRGFWLNGEQSEREVIISRREKEINFQSLRNLKETNKRQLPLRERETDGKKTVSTSKCWDNRQDMILFDTLTHKAETKKRPLSFRSVKLNRASSVGRSDWIGKGGTQSTKCSRILGGRLKANLFVPFSYKG